MNYYIGIDFGTSFSNVSVLGEDGNIECLSSNQMTQHNDLCLENVGKPNSGFPTAISMDVNGNLYCGYAANHIGQQERGRFTDFKTYLREGKNHSYSQFGFSYSVENLTIEYLSFLIKKAKDYIVNHSGSIKDITVGCPVNCKQEYRANLLNFVYEATKKLSLNIEKSMIHIVPESTLAAMDYIQLNPNTISNDAVIAIFDMGGGTTDYSIVKKKSDKDVNIVDTKGLCEYAGNDIRKILMKKIWTEHLELDLQDYVNYAWKVQEIECIEAAKIKMYEGGSSISKLELNEFIDSYNEEKGNVLDETKLRYKTSLDIFESNNEVQSLYDNVVKNFFDIIKKSTETVTYIIMVGGSSKINAIKEKIEEQIVKENLNIIVKRDERCLSTAVSNGAALYPVFQITRSNLNHTYGSKFGFEGKEYIATIIPKGAATQVELPYLFSFEPRSFTQDALEITNNINNGEVYVYDFSIFQHDEEIKKLSLAEYLKKYSLPQEISLIISKFFPRNRPECSDGKNYYKIVYVVNDDDSFLDEFVFWFDKEKDIWKDCILVVKDGKDITHELNAQNKLENIKYENLYYSIQNKTYKSFLETLPITISTRTDTAPTTLERVSERVFPENLLDLCGHNEDNLKCIDTAVEVKEKYGKFNIYQVGLNAYYAVELKGDKPNPNSTAFKVKKAMFGLSSKWKIV